MSDSAEPVVYAIWIHGLGWLSREGHPEDPFTTAQIEVAQAALRLYGGDAEILPFDEDMITLVKLFLKREAERDAAAQQVKPTIWKRIFDAVLV